MRNKKEILLKIHGVGMGDALVSTPTIKKLASVYSTKIVLKSNYPHLFINNPYVINNLHLNDEFDETNYEIFQCYQSPNRKHHASLCARSCAYDLGFDLINEELTLEYYPSNDCIYDFDCLNNYICLHTTSNWKNRTWKPEYWQCLADKLNDLNINIIIIGKDYKENYFDKSICDKKCYVPVGKNVIDLTNDGSSINDMWHLINNAKALVTFDSGPLHLAGTTNTWIFQIGSARHPQFVAPYRHGSQSYKHEFIGGECSLFCASDIKYSVKEWGTINSTHFLPECQEKYSEMKCHPKPEKVFDSIVKNLF